MISNIINNPFHVLGIYCDDSSREIKANISKAAAYSRVNKSVSFTTDKIIHHIISERTPQKMMEAEHKLALPNERIKHSLFWFFANPLKRNNISPDIFDTVQLKTLISSPQSFDDYINLSTLSLLDDDIELSIKCILRVVRDSDMFDDFANCVGGPSTTCSPDDIWHYYAYSLSSHFVAFDIIHIAQKAGCYDEELSAFQKHISKNEFFSIQNEISKSKVDGNSSPLSLCAAAEALISNTKSDLEKIASIYSVNSSEYQKHYESISQQVMNLCVRAYNVSHDVIFDDSDAFKEVCVKSYIILSSLDLSKLSVSVQDRVCSNKSIIEKAAKNPDEYILRAIADNKHICWYCGKPASHSIKKNYKKKEVKVGAIIKTTTTYTRSVEFHVCDECFNYDKKSGKSMIFLFIFVVIIEFCVSYLLVDNYYSDGKFHYDWIWWTLGVNVCGGYFVTALIAALFDSLIEWISGDGKKRKATQIRQDCDHPLVQKLNKEDYY